MGARMSMENWLIGTVVVVSVATAVAAQHAAPAKPAREYSPNLAADYPDRVYFGDTHLHTSYSVDAGMVGDRLGPDEAYRFARGETVTASFGHKARLRRPLDFLVIADLMRAKYKTDFAIQNGGGIRDTFPAKTYIPANPAT